MTEQRTLFAIAGEALAEGSFQDRARDWAEAHPRIMESRHG